MQDLVDYVTKHADRGACKCNECIDRVANPGEEQPKGHTADLIFFEVSLKPHLGTMATAEDLKRLIDANFKGEYSDLNPLDGDEHGFMEIGSWIGDQGLAMMFMGMCNLLGLADLLTPKTFSMPKDVWMPMAQKGYVTIKAKAEKPRIKLTPKSGEPEMAKDGNTN